MTNDSQNDTIDELPTAASTATPADDDALSELFHSCMSTSDAFDLRASDFSSAKDELKGECDMNGKDIGEDAATTDHDLRGDGAPTQHAGATTNSSNKSSNSNSTTSSWNKLPPKSTAIVHSINFNRDRTCLILSTSVGVRIRTLQSMDYSLLPHNNASTSNNTNATKSNISNDSWVHDIPLQGGASYAQLLHSTSLLAVVQPHSPRCCFLYNAKNASNALAALPFGAAVKRIELTRRVLVVITVDGKLHIFHMKNEANATTIDGDEGGDTQKRNALRPTWIQTLNSMHPTDTVRNLSRGLDALYAGSYFDLSPNEDTPYLVCKSFNKTAGTIRVYDPTQVTEVEITSLGGNVSVGNKSNATFSVSNGEAISVTTSSSWENSCNSPIAKKKMKRRIHLLATIDAHEHSVTRMLIGGSFLATASAKGTSIRVFSLPTGECLSEWHRGSRSCSIHSISWNGTADRLVSYGSSGTIHVFDWNSQQQKKQLVGGNMSANYEHGENKDFQEVNENSERDRSEHEVDVKAVRPLYKRIGASLRRCAVLMEGTTASNAPVKHRSFIKLKCPTSPKGRPQHLVVALLDRNNNSGIIQGNDDEMNREETLAMCSLDGELRQYSLKADGSAELVLMETVAFR